MGGGAISNRYDGIVTITNSTLNNNTAESGGAIDTFRDLSLTITNSTLNKNRAKYDGGAIFGDGAGYVNVSNSLFTNNSAGWDGGAIYLSEGNLTIYNCTLINNSAGEGGAIGSFGDGNLTITNSTLNNNTAGRGGAISIFSGTHTLTLTNSTLNNNIATESGGAIYEDTAGYVNVSNSLFTNNSAGWDGGAICSYGVCNLTITNSTLNNNTAESGGAISIWFGDTTLTLTNSTLNNNIATKSGGAIYGDGASYVNVSNSVFTNNSDNSDETIYCEGSITITNCTIDGEIQINTTITINDVSDAQYSDKLTITGCFTRSTGEAIKNATIVLMINGAKYNTKTDANGNYALNYTANKVGTNNVTAIFNGNSVYNSVDTSKTFTVIKKDTRITLNNIDNTEYSDVITIGGKFTRSNGVALKNAPIVLTVNGAKYNTKTDANGNYALNYTATKVGTNNITAIFNGNSVYNSVNTSKTFTVNKKDTSITLNYIPSTQYSEKVTISGGFTRSTGKAIANASIILTVNGVKYTTKTDANGNYTLNYTATKVGTNNVTASFNANSVYNSVNTSKTFTVSKMDTLITLNYLPNVQYSDKVVLAGKLTRSTGEKIANANIVIFINSVKYNTKTDANGNYALNYTATRVGTNNVAAWFAGNSVYNEVDTSRTFTVSKKDTSITLNYIPDTQYSDKVTITGKFTRSTGEALKNATITLMVNGVKYNTKTDANGNYALNYTATKVGTNNVTALFNGNTVYNGADTSKTFTVTKKDTKITINSIATTKISNKVTITGKLTRSTGEVLKNATITVKVNNVNYNVKTDANGLYTLNYTTNKVGTNNVTASFNGNSVYNSVSATRKFTVTN